MVQSMPDVKVPPIPADAAKDFKDGKIVIIGAGVAGLMAANTLKYLGVENYVVLEASDRYGGRLKSCDGLHHDIPLDLGAEWIHNANEDLVKDMLVFQHDADNDLLPSDFIKYKPEFSLPSGRKVGFLQWLYQETKWKRSTWWHWLHTQVYSHVKDKVVLNSPVTTISYDETSSGQVHLTTENGTTYKADKVICTVPLAVLKKGDALIKFSPPLPDQMLQAIEAVDMPAGFRILFDMKEKFYPDLCMVNGVMKQLRDGDDVALAYDALYGKDLSSSSQNILAYVAVGPSNAGELGLMEEEDLIKAVLTKIDQIFDGQGTKNYKSHVLQNWTREPYILGTYTFPGPSRYRQVLGMTVHDKILFAGEHTSAKYHSSVPGAALEGRRAALEAVSGGNKS